MKKPIKTNNMAQTSVEWLVEQLEESGIPLMKDELEMIEQANEMHKSDCEKAWLDGFDFKSNYKDFEDYYNKTYNK